MPIRIALIGLSASAKTSWAAEGHLPYLTSERGRAHYEITALLNSSVAAAEAARAYFKLPDSVKAYGSPDDVANDPDIDLVVCNTRVDVHASVVAPSVRAGKPVFVEWPVAENEGVARGLVDMYKARGAQHHHRSIAGFQGRLSPVVLKVKELLRSGAIGTVLSSDMHAFANLTAAAAYPLGLEYFADRAVGGNPLTIAYAHMIDYVHDTLGDFVDGSVVSRLQLQRPDVAVLTKSQDGKGQIPSHTIKSDVPDLATLSGALAPGSSSAGDAVLTASGATLSVSFRQGPAFPGTSNMVWTINGSAGELRITSPSGPFLHSDSYVAPIEIDLHDHASGRVSRVDWDWADWQAELPVRARIVAMLYERYAAADSAGWAATEARRDPVSGRLPEELRWPTLADGVHRHGEIAALFEQWDRQSV